MISINTIEKKLSRIMMILLTAIGSQCAFNSQTIANENDDYATTEKLFIENQCDEAWELLFPIIEEKNRKALGLFAKAILGRDFIAPGLPGDRLGQLRHARISLIHSLGTDPENDKNWVISILRDESIFSQLINTGKCTETTPIECRKAAVKLGLIPNLDKYIDELKTMTEASQEHGKCNH